MRKERTETDVKKRVKSAALCVAVVWMLIMAACGQPVQESAAAGEEGAALPAYENQENWAYYGIGAEKEADLFLICPTVDVNDEYNMSMDDEATKENFFGALNMERGIYEAHTRMYAPYYRQAAMKVYSLAPAEREPYLALAYKDVSAAFSYYLEHENHGRPIVLAGFSQGADMWRCMPSAGPARRKWQKHTPRSSLRRRKTMLAW